MRETETFEYIRRKYPDKEETWRKVTQLVKFDENLEVKSVHDFNMECYISSFGRLIRNGILCNMAYGDKYDISSMFTDTDGNQVRFKRHQIVMQTFFMGDRRRYDTVDHINNVERFDNSIYNLRWDGPYIVFLYSLMDRHGSGGGCIKHNRQRNRSSIGGLPWNKYDYEHL